MTDIVQGVQFLAINACQDEVLPLYELRNQDLKQLVSASKCDCVKVRASWNCKGLENEEMLEKFLFYEGCTFLNDFYFHEPDYPYIMARSWIRKRQRTEIDSNGIPKGEEETIDHFELWKTNPNDLQLLIKHRQLLENNIGNDVSRIGQVSSCRKDLLRERYATVYIEYESPCSMSGTMVWHAGVTVQKTKLEQMSKSEQDSAWLKIDDAVEQLPPETKHASNIKDTQPKMIVKWENNLEKGGQSEDTIPKHILDHIKAWK